MANRPTPAFLRRPRPKVEASSAFSRFKAEAARPEQQAIFRMMVKEGPVGGRNSLLDGLLGSARSLPGKVALTSIAVVAGVLVGQAYLTPQGDETVASRDSSPGEAELAPEGRVAVSAKTRGTEPPAPAPEVREASFTHPSSGPSAWPLAVAEAKEASTASSTLPLAKPAPEASEEVATAATDAVGSGGPYAWLPEPKPRPLATGEAAVRGRDYRVNLAVVRYKRSADAIRESFARDVPWNGPLDFVFEPFQGGSLRVLGVRGLASQDEANKMCQMAHEHGFECVVAKS